MGFRKNDGNQSSTNTHIEVLVYNPAIMREWTLLEEHFFITLIEPCQNVSQSSENIPCSLGLHLTQLWYISSFYNLRSRQNDMRSSHSQRRAYAATAWVPRSALRHYAAVLEAKPWREANIYWAAGEADGSHTWACYWTGVDSVEMRELRIFWACSSLYSM